MINAFTKWINTWREDECLEKFERCNSDLFMLADIVFEGKSLVFTKINFNSDNPAHNLALAATYAMVATDKSCLGLN